MQEKRKPAKRNTSREIALTGLCLITLIGGVRGGADIDTFAKSYAMNQARPAIVKEYVAPSVPSEQGSLEAQIDKQLNEYIGEATSQPGYAEPIQSVIDQASEYMQPAIEQNTEYTQPTQPDTVNDTEHMHSYFSIDSLITGKPDMSISEIEKYLLEKKEYAIANTGSYALENAGESISDIAKAIYKAAEENEICIPILLAIGEMESNWATNPEYVINNFDEKHNIGNIMNAKCTGLAYFNNWTEGIICMAELLKSYYDNGLCTIEEALSLYCPDPYYINNVIDLANYRMNNLNNDSANNLEP